MTTEKSNEYQNQLFEIDDPEIDPAEIMAQIQSRIQQRREAEGYDEREFPSFEAVAYPGEPDDIPSDFHLHYYLRLANESYGQVEMRPHLAESPATRLPLIGPLWKKLRGEVHNLVLFYVNRAVVHHIQMNRYLVSVLNRLTRQNQEQQRTIMALQAEIETLRQRNDG